MHIAHVITLNMKQYTLGVLFYCIHSPFLISRHIIQEHKFILAFRRNLSALFLRAGRGYTLKMFIGVVVIKQELMKKYTVIDSLVVVFVTHY